MADLELLTLNVSQMKHTPTPWQLHRDYKKAVVDQNGIIICNTSNNNAEHFQFADAARIVACVNACEGITNEQLLRLPEMLHDGTAGLDAASRLAFYLEELLKFCANDFRPPLLPDQSQEYTTAFTDAVKELQKRNPEFDPYAQLGIRSKQESELTQPPYESSDV